MKKILSLVALMIGMALSASAVNLSFTVANGAVTNVFTNALTVSQVSLANATATPSAVTFYDSPSNTNNYVLLSYITTAYVQQSVTNIYTNYFNVATTNVYTALVSQSVTNAQTTNFYNAPLSVVVPTNTTILLDGTYRFYRGMFVTNGAASLTVSLTYQQ